MGSSSIYDVSMECGYLGLLGCPGLNGITIRGFPCVRHNAVAYFLAADRGKGLRTASMTYFCPGAGVSSGGAVSAALRLSAEVENATIVCIICDRGDRYLSTGDLPSCMRLVFSSCSAHQLRHFYPRQGSCLAE